VSVYRDRAHCLDQLGEIDKADKDVKVALDKYPRNPYVVDLAAKIAIKREDYDRAEELVSDLEDIEPTIENFYHRRSTLRAAQRRFRDALSDADKAAGRVPPLHEISANKIDIQIELGMFGDALAGISQIERQFHGAIARDVQLGLRCKLLLRQGDWRAADANYARLANRTLGVHRRLRYEILKQKVEDPAVSSDEKKLAYEELEALEKGFRGRRPRWFSAEIEDDS